MAMAVGDQRPIVLPIIGDGDNGCVVLSCGGGGSMVLSCGSGAGGCDGGAVEVMVVLSCRVLVQDDEDLTERSSDGVELKE
ncbi:hypothetical protein QVD17_00295 [Tagetes erecta]|uniref:Uncharacterized protein n=1 Tax=Tagetes erecta TaxID=13708 RepID=A0AAD8L4S9_TARER|nr:hypothetical protein QVD17_00295 [Tagetes erecta]